MSPERPDEALRALYATISEADLAREVRTLAHLLGWRYFHSFFSVRSEPGFPDVILCKAPRLVVAELKAGRGRVTPPQRVWLRTLAGCPRVDVFVWYPPDLPEIAEILQHGARDDMACVRRLRELLTRDEASLEGQETQQPPGRMHPARAAPRPRPVGPQGGATAAEGTVTPAGHRRAGGV